MAGRHVYEEQRQRGSSPSTRYYGYHPAPPHSLPAMAPPAMMPPYGALLPPPPPHQYAPMAAASHVYPPLHHSHPSQPHYHHLHPLAPAPVAPPQPSVYHGAPQVSPTRSMGRRSPPVVDADRASTTYHGHIKTSTDAILLLAACDLPNDASAMASGVGSMNASASPPPRRIHRRLLESERPDLIQTGSIFVWDEKEAGMRRWTDGRCWSASRVSGCFLTYRELEVRKRSAHDVNGPRANQYKIDGLIKQSFSMTTTSGRKLHIVSYYTKRDLREGRLRRVSEDPRFVGEAGGEWGLQVDEAEFPDPVVTGNEQAAAVAAEVTKQQQEEARRPSATATSMSGDITDGESSRTGDVYATSPRTSAAYNAQSLPNSMPPTPTGVPQGFQRLAHYPDVGGGSSLGKRPNMAAPQTTRPPLKRLRSSSAGDLVVAGTAATAAPAAAASEHPLRRKSDHLLTLNMSESNMRGVAQRDVRPLPHAHQPFGRSASSSRMALDTPSSEQDSAAGALLSLRAFSHAGASSANNTPLTSPEETGTPGNDSDGKDAGAAVMPLSVANSKAMVPSPSTASSSSRPAAPSRLNSDRDALNKLSVRI